MQRWLIANVFSRLPVHDAACAYRKGVSISDHATRHCSHNFLLKLDCRDFFPSLQSRDVVSILRENSRLLGELVTDESDVDTIRRFVCRNDHLTIGAPTSPIVSNVIMFSFDRDWTMRSNDLGVSYSRYADDLCFSCDRPNLLAGVLERLRNDLANRASPRLVLNDEKTVFTSRKRLRRVVGLVLTPTRGISIGRAKKRRIKSQVFRYQSGNLPNEEVDALRGMISYINSVEPAFLDILKRKYEAETMRRLGR